MENQAQAQALSFDELFALGEVDEILRMSEEKVKIKTQGLRFAGMGTEDVVQDALIKVYTALSDYDSSKARVSTFLDHVIDNSIRDTLRKAGAIKNLVAVNAVPINSEDSTVRAEVRGFSVRKENGGFAFAGLEPGYEAFEIMEDIMNHMDLTDRQKEAVQLYTAGYSLAEIANVFHVSRSRMSQIWSQIVTKCAAVAM